MDSFIYDFNINSTSTNDTNSSDSNLDWAAFQSASSLPTLGSPFSLLNLSQQDDAVAPNNQSIIKTARCNEEIYFEMEHFFNDPNHQQQAQSQPILQQQQHDTIMEPIHASINISNQAVNNRHYMEASPQAHLAVAVDERPMSFLPTPLVPRVSSSRSQCYHKLPDHAVKLMQEWYNAHLENPYPRSPNKKRFITEGHITAQQCRSWFANRRQRLKHVKRNHSKSTNSRLNYSSKTK